MLFSTFHVSSRAKSLSPVLSSLHLFSSLSSQNNFTRNTTSTHSHIGAIEISSASVQGQRKYMEDEFITSNDGRLVGVFDGHGGASVSKYLKSNFFSLFLQMLPENRRQWSNGVVENALTQVVFFYSFFNLKSTLYKQQNTKFLDVACLAVL